MMCCGHQWQARIIVQDSVCRMSRDSHRESSSTMQTMLKPREERCFRKSNFFGPTQNDATSLNLFVCGVQRERERQILEINFLEIEFRMTSLERRAQRNG